MVPNPLKNIPSVNELLESPPLAKLVDRLSRNVVVSTVRTVLDEARVEVRTAASERTLPSVGELAERIVRRITESGPHGPRPVVNATGVLLHSELGSPPLADRAVEEMAAVAANYTAAEADPAAALEGLLGELTGAEAATVVQSGAAATMLTLAALAASREVVVSRAHLIETEPGCRVADLISAAGAVLREVGAANTTRLEDYTQAIGEQTAALMMVHPDDLLMAGSTTGITLEELVDVGRRHKLPVILLAPSAALIDCSPFGLADQPIVSDALKAGADVVLLQGDKLLGGPRSGIVVGRRALVDQIAGHSIRRAFDLDEPIASALAATLGLYREPDQACQAIPLLRLLSTSADNLKNRAERLAPQIAASSAVATAESQTGDTYLCPQPIAAHQLPTCRIVVEPAQGTADRLAKSLRLGAPSVVGQVEQDRLILDLRSVLPRQDIDLTSAFESLDSEEEA